MAELDLIEEKHELTELNKEVIKQKVTRMYST